MMKILLCHNRYQRAGGEDQVFEDEARLLTRRGWRVVRYERHNDDIRAMRRWRVAKETLWNPRTYDEISRLVSAERPDLVHCTNTFPLMSPSLHAAVHAQGIPIVQSLHNFRLLCANAFLMRTGRVCEKCIGRAFPWPAIVHACYRDSRLGSAVAAALIRKLRKLRRHDPVDRYIALSRFSRDKFIEGGLDPERLSVKPNFVDPDPGPGEGRGNFALFVGRLDVEKGLDVLLRAWQLHDEPIRLRIAGDGPLRDQVEQAARRDGRIEPLGWQRAENIQRLLGEARVLVFPSIWYENCPKTLLESLARGTPIVASGLGAMLEFVRDGDTGLHFTPGDARDLATKLVALWHDESRLRAMRLAARQDYLRHYTADANYAMLVDIYAQALARHGKTLAVEVLPPVAPVPKYAARRAAHERA